MKHTYIKFTVLSGIVFSLSACTTLTGESGYFRDKSGDYVDELVTPDLVIPGNLKPIQSAEFMEIPDISNHAKLSKDVAVPRADRRVVREDGVIHEIVTRDNNSVLVINRPVHMVKPYLDEFWAGKEITVAEKAGLKSAAEQGVVVTDWVQLGETSRPGFMRRLVGNVFTLENADTSHEKFRLSARSGSRAGTSEITLEHVRRRDGTDLTVPVNWTEERHTSPVLENMLLNEVLVGLIQSREQTVTGRSSSTIHADQISMQQAGNGNPQLRIDAGFAPSWQAVENALTEMGITIVDRNRTLGLIYIDVNVDGEQITPPQEEKNGWFSGWFSDDEKVAEAEAQASSEYTVRVHSVTEATHITLEKDLNTLPPANVSKQFLEHLSENL